MSSELEWDIRKKMADIQLFLTSGAATEDDYKEIDEKLGKILESVKPKTGETKCGA